MQLDRCRAREFGLTFGDVPTGPANGITDVPDVLVGHSTVVKGEGKCRIGDGPIRSGVTAILPVQGDFFFNPVQAAVHVINGFGKSIGLMQVQEVGTVETPILITSTLNVPKVADALLDYLINDTGLEWMSINPVVMECNDFFLNDVWGRHLGKPEVAEAIEGASSGPVSEGCVGAGTGLSAYGYKGGIGTSSRAVTVANRTFTLGALVATNMGKQPELTISGVPVGKSLESKRSEPEIGGSIIIILATDAPLSQNQLRRVAVRATHGLARTGSYSAYNSGDVVLAFSTTRRILTYSDDAATTLPEVAGTHIDAFFCAAADVVEESILNAMFTATTVTGRDGNTLEALPLDKVKRLLENL